MKAIITGSKGFVGKELCKKLGEKNVEVVEYALEDGFDVLDAEQLKEKAAGCSWFVHLAAVLDEKSKDLFKVNVVGTKNAVEAAMDARCKRFLYLSSTGVYGDFEGTATEETPIRPSTAYEKTKADAEKLVEGCQEAMPVTIVRSALVLGPNKYWKSIAKMVGRGFPVIGSGENKWQIVYYKDLVDAIVFLLQSREEAENEVFNVAEEGGESLNGLVEIFRKKLGTTMPAQSGGTWALPKGSASRSARTDKIKHMSIWKAKLFAAIHSVTKGKKTLLKQEYIERLLKNRSYSIEKICALGWKPKYSTEQAVEETVQGLGI